MPDAIVRETVFFEEPSAIGDVGQAPTMTGPILNQHPKAKVTPKSDAGNIHGESGIPAQKWSEKVWSENILSQQSVQIPRAKLQKKIDDFLAHASVQEQTELERSRQELQSLIQHAKASKKGNGEGEDGSLKAKIKNGWSSVSETAYRYSQILDPMLSHAPEYVSLAYGGIKIILMAQINYQELKEKVQLHLEQIATRFEIIDHLTAYIPTKNLIATVAQAYGLFTKFLGKAVKHYTRSRAKAYLKALAKPWDRFQELVDAIGQTFVDIKDIAQYHGLLAGRFNLEVSQQTLALVKAQEKRTDDHEVMLEEILSQLHAISIQFTKDDDVRETASLVRQHVDERRDDPTLQQKTSEPTVEGASMLEQLGGLFADLKSYNEETLRRKVAIEEIPDMRNHRSSQRNLLRSEKVLSWIECETSQLLWVEGNSVLRRSEFNAYFAIPLLVMGESCYESTLILRHFCGGKGLARKPTTLLQALLYQVIERNPSILETKKDAFRQENTATVQDLWSLLVNCLEDVNAQCTFIIIDSFDNLEAAESGANEKSILLSQLDSIVKDKTKFVKVLLTASLAQPLTKLPDEYHALTHFKSSPRPGGLRRSLSIAAVEDQAQLISHQIIEIQERRCKFVTFQEIPFLYPSGTLIYQKDGSNWRAYIAAELGGMDPQPFGRLGPLQIRAWSMDHDGVYFTRKYHTLTVSRFSGRQAITSLKFIPAGYLPDEPAIRKTLARRGRRYWELGSNVSYKQFEGKHGLVRIVIDQEMRPLEEPPQEHAEQFQRNAAENIKPQVLMTCPPDIAVYLLSELRWSKMNVDAIQDLVVDEYRNFHQLILDNQYKDILSSLVPGYSTTEKQDSISPSQGSVSATGNILSGTTVLLHGAPGCGKTFSVECLAETVKRPLLRLMHSKLGGSHHEVTESFEEFFRLSDRWGCIMLLDDVDVYLSQRQNDMSQNIMVTLFMQLTEMHNGLLFLTTNRVGTFDKAFLSRIHMKLSCPSLGQEKARAILELTLRRINDRLRKAGIDCIMGEHQRYWECIFSHNSNEALNGREIVNICEMAFVLARYDAKKMGGYERLPNAFTLQDIHFEGSIKMSYEFDAYMNEMRGISARHRADYADIRERVRDLRSDDFYRPLQDDEGA